MVGLFMLAWVFSWWVVRHIHMVDAKTGESSLWRFPFLFLMSIMLLLVGILVMAGLYHLIRAIGCFIKTGMFGES